MRGSSRMGMLLAGLFFVACGGPTTPKEPIAETPAEGEATKADETPKWEGATKPAPADTSTTPPTTGTTGVHEAPTRRSDQYDKEGTEVVLKRAARQVKANCGQAKDDSGKAVGPWGKATVQVQLGHNGHSKGVTVPSPFQGTPGGACVEKAFSNLAFPPWGGEDAEVSWDIELVEPGKK